MQSTKNNSLRTILGYTPAKLVTGIRWFVEFYAYDPELETMHRKRVSVPKMTPASVRRTYANDMVVEINRKLSTGWNPFMDGKSKKEYTLFEKACESYFRYLHKMTSEGLMRPKSYNGYTSFLNGFLRWNKEQPRPIRYTYQFQRAVIDEFLDWLWMDGGRSARTRDNYLGWFRTFSRYLVEKGFLPADPTEGLTMVQGKRKVEKNRTTIPKDQMLRIKEYLEAEDKHFLLACHILYYCFVRPKEMSYLKVGDISVKAATLSIHAEVAKNRKDAVVTIPDCVMKSMIDLGVLSCPADWYVFSSGCRPGPGYRDPKFFSDLWAKMAKVLKFPPEYKFYSLKDTGITDMIRDHTDLLAVRDQARHYSLEMTDLYTPLSCKDANREIKARESYF